MDGDGSSGDLMLASVYLVRAVLYHFTGMLVSFSR